VLADKGIDFEYTHDLRRLIELVEELGLNFPFITGEIVMYTEFAVPLRYEDLSTPSRSIAALRSP
jgi:hypothetical protein